MSCLSSLHPNGIHPGHEEPTTKMRMCLINRNWDHSQRFGAGVGIGQLLLFYSPHLVFYARKQSSILNLKKSTHHGFSNKIKIINFIIPLISPSLVLFYFYDSIIVTQSRFCVPPCTKYTYCQLMLLHPRKSKTWDKEVINQNF